ncbi:PREDICTED: protein LAZ1-like isoform X2 [Nelumbo nucifera]|uniref:Protein LAZ1-like isoform X2 n=1 Tax=Nelumbo nucifera TaxID=4432 RepID=A0A1U8AJM7_NELNU|nr:PREDICTED: protein LAZ1-like isoform X2 [Nelumbo nucifera]
MKITEFFNLILQSYHPATWVELVAGALVLLTLSLSTYLLFEHLSAYKNPEEQKFLIGVILMVPCYAVESFVSLVDPSISVDCEILRDCYEAFAMYCFGRYLVACLGGEERTIEFIERQGRAGPKTPLLEPSSERGVVKHPFPMNYLLKPWKLNQWFYQVIKFGIVQYMIIKTFTAILAVILEAFGVYCEGEFKWGCGYPYMAVVLNFSQSWALYCLVQFYTVTKDELEHIKPLAKFLTFKSIVFLTWWQGVGIALIYTLGIFKSSSTLGLPSKSSVQDFIICIEIVNDVRFTVNQAVEPVERGITRFNEKLHKISQNIKRHDKERRRTKDDSCITSSPARRVIRGIDDPLLNGSFSDSGVSRSKRHRRKSGYTSAESGGESSSDQTYGGYQIRGHRWVTKD